jgi:hypothetical protein
MLAIAILQQVNDESMIYWGSMNGFTLLLVVGGFALFGFMSMRFTPTSVTEKQEKDRDAKMLAMEKRHEQEMERLDNKISVRLLSIDEGIRTIRREFRDDYVHLHVFNGLGGRVTTNERDISEIRAQLTHVAQMATQSNSNVESLSRRLEEVLKDQLGRLVERVEELWDSRHNK